MYNIIRLVGNSDVCVTWSSWCSWRRRSYSLVSPSVCFFMASKSDFDFFRATEKQTAVSSRAALFQVIYLIVIVKQNECGVSVWPVLTIGAALQILRQSLHLLLQEFVLFWILCLSSSSFSVCKCLRMTAICTSITKWSLRTPVSKMLQIILFLLIQHYNLDYLIVIDYFNDKYILNWKCFSLCLSFDCWVKYGSGFIEVQTLVYFHN